MSIDIRGLSKHFNGFAAVKDVSFHLETGRLAAILGPSGSGKSTLLRMIAGLETPDSGDVYLTGRETTGVSPRDRNVGFVFQHYALFRNMNVKENIGFGLRVRKVRKTEIDRRVDELLDLVQLRGWERQYPSQLSGGQRQRVAVARALAPRPSVMLLDEPFGALDAKVREDLRGWIRELHRQTRVTTLFVTHDQHEALEIAHTILVMNNGCIEQVGSPEDIFDRPATPFVAEFVGESNYVEGILGGTNTLRWGPFSFRLDRGTAGETMRVYFRPGDVTVRARPHALGNTPATIAETRFKGPVIEVLLDVGEGHRITAHVPKGLASAHRYTAGSGVFVGISDFRSFPAPSSATTREMARRPIPPLSERPRASSIQPSVPTSTHEHSILSSRPH